jgi:hypothetical protein
VGVALSSTVIRIPRTSFSAKIKTSYVVVVDDNWFAGSGMYATDGYSPAIFFVALCTTLLFFRITGSVVFSIESNLYITPRLKDKYRNEPFYPELDGHEYIFYEGKSRVIDSISHLL